MVYCQGGLGPSRNTVRRANTDGKPTHVHMSVEQVLDMLKLYRSTLVKTGIMRLHVILDLRIQGVWLLFARNPSWVRRTAVSKSGSTWIYPAGAKPRSVSGLVWSCGSFANLSLHNP